jgi:MoxR-like ATPase
VTRDGPLGDLASRVRSAAGLAPAWPGRWQDAILAAALEALATETGSDPALGAVERLRDNVASALKGKGQAVDLALTALIAGGHVLIEDVPGVGKTTLARALAQSIDGTFRRIQFTSDLLPSDITGTSVYLQDRAEFEFRRGPIFANVVLADEINRTTPKTQSSLLEAMNEGQVSVDGTTHPLPAPFIVAATQNPHEYYGTYPLPESQLDRFMLRIRIGYPEEGVERRIVGSAGERDPVQSLRPVASCEQVRALQRAVDEVRVDETLLDYLMEIVAATRASSLVELGLSTRGAMMLHRAARAHAMVKGRSYCLPDDVKGLVVPVAAHRIVPAGHRDGSLADRDQTERILRDILEALPVPV